MQHQQCAAYNKDIEGYITYREILGGCQMANVISWKYSSLYKEILNKGINSTDSKMLSKEIVVFVWQQLHVQKGEHI